MVLEPVRVALRYRNPAAGEVAVHAVSVAVSQ
jgi:hypothetical protein